MARQSFLRIKIQIMCGAEIAMGPGKADLLDAIALHRSISAAARAMGISYRRAWLLVDTMNRCWWGPLVATTPGNQKAGAQLTPLGAHVLAHYRRLQDEADRAGSAGLAALTSQLRPAPHPPQRQDGPAPDGSGGAAGR